MAGDQDRLACRRGDRHFGRLRRPENLVMGLVQQRQDFQRVAAALQTQVDHLRRLQVGVYQIGERVAEIPGNFRIAIAEFHRMVIIGGGPFDCEKQERQPVGHLAAGVLAFALHAAAFRHFQQVLARRGQGAAAGRAHPAAEGFQMIRIEIHVGHRGQQRIQDHPVERLRRGAAVDHLARQPLREPQQKILQP